MIAFNKPYLTGNEFAYMREAVQAAQLSGNGRFTQRCQQWLQDRVGARRALLTQSCTAALEMAALLADLQPGDEVIMPSFTFVSTANAFALRGAVPVFVDVRPDTLTIDTGLVEGAITPRTRAIVPVHYAGVGCDMAAIVDIARRHSLTVIEDAAQALGSDMDGRPLGSFGQLATFSFHETKNVMSGEGGALLVNDDRLVSRAEVLWEKGTDRVRFHRGEISRYTWVDLGSSYLPSELTAAFLWAQLERADEIRAGRLALWNSYYEGSIGLPCVRRPIIPSSCNHNAHMFYLLLEPNVDRDSLLATLNARGVNAVSHYVPLHSAPAGRRFGRPASSMSVTDDCSARLIRLPLWMGMEADAPKQVLEVLHEALAAQAV